MTALDPVLQPFELRHLGLKNRIMSTAHAPSYVEDGKPKQRYRLYHEEKAKGGLALTMFGGSTTTAPDSPRPSARSTRPATRSFPGSSSSPTRSIATTAR